MLRCIKRRCCRAAKKVRGAEVETRTGEDLGKMRSICLSQMSLAVLLLGASPSPAHHDDIPDPPLASRRSPRHRCRPSLRFIPFVMKVRMRGRRRRRRRVPWWNSARRWSAASRPATASGSWRSRRFSALEGDLRRSMKLWFLSAPQQSGDMHKGMSPLLCTGSSTPSRSARDRRQPVQGGSEARQLRSNLVPYMECAPAAGQDQAAVLTEVRALRSSNWMGLR
jgi:hypothetical protein